MPTQGDTDEDKAGWPTKDVPATEYPKRDEPLLLVGGSWALTADGMMFQVHTNDLADKPQGPPVFPSAARPLIGSFVSHTCIIPTTTSW